VTEADAGYPELMEKIWAERGFRCASYKDQCLRRRIAVRMRARGVATYADYVGVLDRDRLELDRLVDALTINVTKLFRNWDVYAAVAERVVPPLWDAPKASVRVWSAGCSSGDEAFSIAALFHRHAEATGTAHDFDRLRVLGTDIDRRSLMAADIGEFDEADFADTPVELRSRYFSAEHPHRVAPELRSVVRFERGDLLVDPPMAEPQDLVVCRNVLIYFGRPAQERVFGVLHDALAPNGFLVLGRVEALIGAARSMFIPVDARERIYRKR
jgi:chemotaxis methyl-accepting protein methylase